MMYPQRSSIMSHLSKINVFIGVVFAFIAIIVVSVVLLIVDICSTTISEPIDATVIERIYKPSSVNVGTGITNKQQVIITTSGESEQWIVIVHVNGEIVKADASASIWARVVPEQKIKVVRKTGKILGLDYGYVCVDHAEKI